jgi:hypothetical protein
LGGRVLGKEDRVANYAPDVATLAGTTPTFHAAAAGDSFDNNGNVLLYIKSTGTLTVLTVDAPGAFGPTAAKQFDPDVGFTTPATGDRVLGPFPTARFNDVNGRVQLAWSSLTGITWAAVQAA